MLAAGDSLAGLAHSSPELGPPSDKPDFTDAVSVESVSPNGREDWLWFLVLLSGWGLAGSLAPPKMSLLPPPGGFRTLMF